eukprot:403337662
MFRAKECKNPIKLTFEDVRFGVTIKINKKDSQKIGVTNQKQEILKGVSGYAMPGQTCYIMGSSGAGKTSLLNILSDRMSNKKGTTHSGRVLINDTIPLTQTIFGSIAGYVMQDDILFQYYTPRQALRFAARLKLNNISIEEQDERVETLIQELGLFQTADVLIGSLKTKTLSGGERKRVAIGVELITDPSLILLDEPTSGLDSFKAVQIVKLLQRQARKGKTVIATIHQPGSESFACFDRIILMCDGNIVYQGDAAQSTFYFNQLGIQCPKFANPADFFMRILTINYPKTEKDEEKIQFLNEKYNQILQHNLESESQQLQLKQVDFSQAIDYAPTKIQMKELFIRTFAQMRLDPQAFTIKIGQTIINGLICLPLFWGLSGNDFVDQIGLAGFLFLLRFNLCLSHVGQLNHLSGGETSFYKRTSKQDWVLCQCRNLSQMDWMAAMGIPSQIYFGSFCLE